MPCDYSKYPPNWFPEIRPAILERAQNCCERCGVANYAVVQRIISKREREVKIVLTIAHLNHDVTDNRPENLAALCQRCHNQHDVEFRAENRKRNRDAKNCDEQGELFEGAAEG